MSMSPAKAKRFVIDRILDQARLDGVSLNDVEIQMLGFEAETANAKEIETEQRFQREVNEAQYEKAVSGLIRRAYQRDKENRAMGAWEQSLDALAERDLYLNVMIQRAGISGVSGFANFFDWRLLVGIIPALVFVAFGSFIAFSRTGEKLIPNDLLRLTILVICLIAPLLVHRLRRKILP
jgi:hypothetical protein